MPTIISSTSFSANFALELSPKQILVTDTTDYAGPSIPTTGVKSVLVCTAPDGTIFYSNNNYSAPDITTNVSTTNSIVISLPLNSDGTVVQGTYAIQMNTQIIDGVNPTYILSSTNNYSFIYTSPTVSIEQTTDCISPLFTSIDATNYVVGGVTPTITRTHDLYYPVAISTTPITSTGTTITTSTFYSGTQTTVITTDLSYTFSSDLIVTDEVTGSSEAVVDCTFICDIYCCLKTIYNNKENNRGVNSILFNKYSDELNEVMSLVELAIVAIDCNKQTDADIYITKIKAIANCNTDCTCDSGTPSLVQGISGSGINFVVASGNNAIAVSSATVSGTTTYTITFSAALLSKLNASYNTVVAAGTNTTVSSATSGNVTTYTVNATQPTSSNRLELRCLIQYSTPSAPTVTITTSNITIDGTATNFQAPTIESVDYGVALNWKNFNNLFKVSNFQISPTSTYKVHLQSAVIGYNVTQGNPSEPVPLPSARLIQTNGLVEVVWIYPSSGLFYFKFLDGGSPITNTDMTQFTSIILSIYISE